MSDLTVTTTAKFGRTETTITSTIKDVLEEAAARAAGEMAKDNRRALVAIWRTE